MRRLDRGRIGRCVTWVAAAGVLPFCAAALPLDIMQVPGGNFPQIAENYLLQDFDAQDRPEEVQITNILQNRYFYSNCFEPASCHRGAPEGAVVFRVPSGFASTPNSHYPRVELRAKRNFMLGSTFDITQSGDAYIVQNPQTRSIIIAQIHGDKAGGSELLKLRWDDGAIVAGTKEHYGDPENRTPLLTGVALGQKISYTIEAQGMGTGMHLRITVAAEGRTSTQHFDFPASGWSDVALYFKAGNYNQSSSPDGGTAIVAYSALDIRYR
ncbi:polysaccharide lyase family 7 protein [Stenotrophomonas sp. 24(2023)]|uniref:polysaccharide lyase family 7 protein n=1 Tax=Stenotrophomonas sp. 24(2023) TaxID=3068324 RepID=UPI0027E18EC7|nr:polysaccharide lyase family 7 protein [Stenotrophomonas sp. 24(2023)]WMJ69222.1 polysaccharide lyase family 7 protein [Stenotrophomonas sp. 24(2023)]